MRLKRALPAIALVLVAACGAVLAASQAARVIERRSAEDVSARLMAEGQDWVRVETDGLLVTLSGTAKDEATRFEALSAAGKVVDSARVVDAMKVAEAAEITPPQFSVEILRNDNGVSVIGLIPAASDRAALLERIGRAVQGAEVIDLLETADFPTPKGWQRAVDFGLGALSGLPQSKVSIAAKKVSVTAIAESRGAKNRIESGLRQKAPEGLQVALDISAPRPVITPFTLRFLLDDKGARFDACSAAGEEGRRVILDAARAAGAEGDLDCTIGLGVPSPDWARAVAQGIAALDRLGGGTLTFSDGDVALVARQGTAQAAFDREVGQFEGALPEAFSLHAELPEPPDAAADEEEGPPQFVATRSPEGLVQLRGRMPDDRTRAAVESFARARFGNSQVTDATRTVEGLPAGWAPRILAALEAMSLLHNGAVIVEPDKIDVSGTAGNPDARAEVARILTEQLGEGADFEIAVSYDKALDAELGLPTPEECVAQINTVLSKRKITFAPGSDTIDAEARESIDKIAELMKQCQDVPMEIGGYTDSQGRESMNQELSQSRAEAVVNALLARRVLTSNLVAKGHGEEDPIADNSTEEGREANRRIEFKLIVPEEGASAETGETEAASGDAGAGEAGAEAGSGSGDDGKKAGE